MCLAIRDYRPDRQSAGQVGKCLVLYLMRCTVFHTLHQLRHKEDNALTVCSANDPQDHVTACDMRYLDAHKLAITF